MLLDLKQCLASAHHLIVEILAPPLEALRTKAHNLSSLEEMLFTLFDLVADFALVLAQLERLHNEHQHVYCNASKQHNYAGVADFKFGERVGHNGREEDHVVHQEDQLRLVEDVHLLVETSLSRIGLAC